MNHSRTVCRTARLFTALGLLAFCAVACSAPSPPSSADPAGPFPPRPYAIDVTKIDPCSALTPDQARQRGARMRGTGTVKLAGVAAPSKTCGWTNFDDGYGYNFQTIETDAAVGLKAPGTNSVIVIDGFGAVLNVAGESNVTGSGVPQLCQILVDVNTNQSIRLQVGGTDTKSYGSKAEVKESCDRVQIFAREALINLSTQQR